LPSLTSSRALTVPDHVVLGHATISSPLPRSASDADAPLSPVPVARLEAFLPAVGLAASSRLGGRLRTHGSSPAGQA
jgi:hypothetical protein